MLNRRTVSRYHLAKPLPGYIEHGEARHLGQIVEFSTAGFRLRLPDTPKEAFIASRSDYDFGEIIYKQDEIGGFGEIRYVRSEGGDLYIGFKWDDVHAEENIQKSFAIISELVSSGIAGCVNAGNGVASLAGHVSAVLSGDLQQCLAQGLRRVSLRECTSIDAGGIALLAGLEDAGVPFEGVSLDIAAQLQRYRLDGPDSLLPDFSLVSA
jgi:hypothetical protein